MQIDREEGNDIWKWTDESDIYDYKLLREELHTLKELKKKGNVPDIMLFLQTSLSRNLGNIGDPQLYQMTNVGTKKLIQDYIDEVIGHVYFICDNDFADISINEKLNFLRSTLKTFGKTSLLFSGGGTFGLAHVGKSL
jgi:TAG lipase/steryl ester hydrolase/phospholipase A2/LPA acyltransferase